MFAVRCWRVLSSLSRDGRRTTSLRFLAVDAGSNGSKNGASNGEDASVPNERDTHENSDTAGDNEDDYDGKPEMVDAWNSDAPAGPEWRGPRGYEPTRYGDWSKNGRVSDF